MLDIAGIIRSHQKEENTVDWLLSLLSQIPPWTYYLLKGSYLLIYLMNFQLF